MKLSPHGRMLAAGCLLLLCAELVGCQSAPTNPFAPPASIDKAAASDASSAAIADKSPGSQARS
ncbi:MAG: hypothetical protein WD845_14010 [Pirellulales bacterium]